MLDLKIEQILLVIVIFILYCIIDRKKYIDPFSISINNCNASDCKVLLRNINLTDIHNSFTGEEYKNYGRVSATINNETYYKSGTNNNISKGNKGYRYCEQAEVIPGLRSYVECEHSDNFCRKNVLNDTCISTDDLLKEYVFQHGI